MSDRKETYEVTGRPHVLLYLNSGDIRIKEGAQGAVVVAMSGNSELIDSVEIDATADTVTVRSTQKKRRWFAGSIDTVVTVPADSDLTIHNGAGDIMLGVTVAELELHNGAGDVRGDDVQGPSEFKVGAGDIRMGALGGPAKVSSASGDIRIDKATELVVSTASGDLYLGDVNESARIKSATGDIRIRKFAGSDLEIKTMSGDCAIGLIPGVIVKAQIKTMSGDFRNRIKPSSGEKTGSMNLAVTSFSGDVVLKSAK